MAEDHIDITAETPKLLTTDVVKASDVVVTTGCGDTCTLFPGKRSEVWDLPDPAGQDLGAVRAIRDQIKPHHHPSRRAHPGPHNGVDA